MIYNNDMLRGEQYGGINGRQIQDPIRILAKLKEDADVTKKELHIFSADLSKAFDTLEYWSHAMSWRALGAPRTERHGQHASRHGQRGEDYRIDPRGRGDLCYCQECPSRFGGRGGEMGSVYELLVRMRTQHSERYRVQDQ